MADKKRYTFIEKKESERGMFAFRLAIAAAALFAIDVFISFLYRGEGGPVTGALALTAMLLAAYGFYSGMKSLSEKEVSAAYPVAGTILSGVVMVAFLALYLGGI